MKKLLLLVTLLLCLTLCFSCGDSETGSTQSSVTSGSTSSGNGETSSGNGTTSSGTGTTDLSTPVHKHSYGEWVTTKEPTCTEAGEKEQTCSCGDTVTEAIEATGHTEEIVAGKASACTEAGLTDGKKCSVCGEILVAQVEIPATGHNYESRVCVVCNEKAPSEGLEYTLSDDNTYYEVTGIGTCTDTEIVIPSMYENKPVTGIGVAAFSDCTGFTSIEIPDSVTSIGNSAFSRCADLTSIEMPNSVTSIGDSAFSSCTSLTSIEIPDSVTSIGDYAFTSCKSLTSITVDVNNANYKSVDGVLYSKDGTNLIQYPIGKKDTSFEIPDSVTSIGSYAFYYCSSLKSISIHDNVTSIGLEAFYYCSNLEKSVYKNGWYLGNEENPYLVLVGASNTKITSCTINENTKVIADHAFWTCRSLKKITIPSGVRSIGYGAFFACSGLTSITVEANNANYKSMDGVLYSKDGTELIKYPVGKTDTSFEVPDSVTSIGEGAFSGGCISLTSIVISNNVTSISNSAFSNCTALASIEIPDSVTSIGDSAFLDCSSLTSIVIPVNVTSIGEDAFSYCTAITSITVDLNNANYKSIDGVLYSKDGTKLIRYPIDKTETSFEIPDGVTSISDSAFEACSNIVSVAMPDSVTSLGNRTFAGCSNLTSITMSDSVTSIGSSAFSSCSSLTSVTMSNSLTSIEYGVFSGCSSLTSITIPDGVTSIGEWAFQGCTSLTSITIPDGVTSIGEWAFRGCTSLTSITIPDSVTSIGADAFQVYTSLTINCEAESQPDGWDSDWCGSDCIVVWGYKAEE